MFKVGLLAPFLFLFFSSCGLLGDSAEEGRSSETLFGIAEATSRPSTTKTTAKPTTTTLQATTSKPTTTTVATTTTRREKVYCWGSQSPNATDFKGYIKIIEEEYQKSGLTAYTGCKDILNRCSTSHQTPPFEYPDTQDGIRECAKAALEAAERSQG